MDWVRKIVFVEERVLAEAGKAVAKPVTRVAGIAVIHNPFAGQGHVEDLASLFDVGAKLGEALMPDVVRRLPNPATSYGKAAIVGLNGDFEHGGALIHPKLGKPMRAAAHPPPSPSWCRNGRTTRCRPCGRAARRSRCRPARP